MTSYRETAWSKRLTPLAVSLRDKAIELVDALSDSELTQLLTDCEKPNKENCSFVIYQANSLIADAASMIRIKRSRARKIENAERNQS